MSTYALTWDEFLEFNQGALPSASIASFIATVFIAIAVGVFGVVLTYAVDSGSKATASSFCWLSLSLFAVAFWDLRTRTARRKSQAVQHLQSVYQHYYSSERSFAFDQEKWTFQTESGKQEVLWTGLSSAAEWDRVITLSARGQVTAAVPKRMLSTEELDALRRIAIGSTVGTWHSRMSVIDFVLTEVPSLWRRHPFLMIEAHLAGLFFFVMIANDMYHASGSGTYWGWSVAGLFLFLTVTTQFWYFLIKYLTSHNEWRAGCEVGFSSRGVRVKTLKVDFFSAWSNFRRTREAIRCLLLFTDASRYYSFPKRCVPAEQLAMARNALHAKLAGQSSD